MLRLTRTAMKYLVIGLLFGLLFAPRSGRETRRMLRDEMVEYLNVLFDNLEVVLDRLGVMRVALVHYQDNLPPAPLGSLNQLRQQHAEAPGGFARLDVIIEQATPIAPRTEDRLLAVLAWRPHPQLSAARHPGSRQVRVKVKLGFVLVP